MLVNRMIRSIAATFLALAPLPLAAQALSPAETAQVDAVVADALKDTGVPSASIAIVRGDRIVFAHAYGKQSETMATADPAALYQIASISKQFTAAAILLLQDEGKLKLDDPVSKYVPGITRWRHDHDPRTAQPYRGAAGLLATGLQLRGDGDPGDAAADRRSLGEETARLRTGHTVAIFEHGLCRRRDDRREGIGANRCLPSCNRIS